jgi:cytochrome c oxidase assembly protein subunit 15
MAKRRTLTQERYRRVTLLSLWLLSFIVVSGASVRLSGSGLGCSDWPTCERDQLVAEVSDVHAMVEFVNRLITGLVSAVVIAAVLGSMMLADRRRDLTMWSWGLVAGVIAQIIVGALVVWEHLPPSLVITHFLLSMVLVWNALVLHHRAAMPAASPPVRHLPAELAKARLLSALATAVLVTGTIVTGSGPHSGSETEETRDALTAQGVDVSGLDASELEVDRLPFDVPDVARIHAVVVLAFLAATLWLLYHLWRSRQTPDLFRVGQRLVYLILIQAAIGYIQYFSDVPPLLVGFHIAGATAVWVATIDLHLRVRHPQGGVGDREPAGADGRSVETRLA